MARTDPAGTALASTLVVAAVLVPILNQLVPASSPLHVSTYVLTLVGKYLCYAILALAVDLIWGYCGILSLVLWTPGPVMLIFLVQCRLQ